MFFKKIIFLGGCSQWVLNRFPKFSNGFFNMFPIAPCFLSHILCPKFGPKKWLQNKEILLTTSNLRLSGLQSLINFNFFFFFCEMANQ